MPNKYDAWIKANYPTMESALGKCHQGVKAMKEQFPELEVTNGFVHFVTHQKRAHWWLKDAQGNIVDPTAIQYPEYMGEPITEYEEIDDSHDARKYPSVKCPNCGEYYYQKPETANCSPCCTSSCYQEYVDYLNG